MIDGMSTPIMYEDIGSMSMRPMTMPLGMGGMFGGMYNTSYLGGVKMHEQPHEDNFVTMEKKEKESRSAFKTSLLVLGGLLALTYIGPLRRSIAKAGGLTKYLEGKFQKLKDSFKVKPKKQSWFSRIFKKSKKTNNPAPTPKKPNWFSRQFSKFRNWSRGAVL